MSLAPELTALENAGLIRLAAAAPELAYAFRHGLMQDAAYATLLRAQRQAWHLATAEVLERVYLASGGGAGEGAAGGLPPILAHHFSRADDKLRALQYLILSGDAAFSRYANIEAIDFYSRALEIAVSPDADADRPVLAHLFARLGRALELTSQFAAALEHYHRQEALAQQLGDLSLELASLTARATILSTANFALDVGQAVTLLERARRLAHTIGDRAAEAKISWTLLLNNTMSGGDIDERVVHGERALHLALELGERELLAFIYNDLWYAYAGVGRWPQALAGLAAGREICRDIGNLPALCENLTRTALSHIALGSYSAALGNTDQAYQLAESIQSADFRALARAFEGIIHLDRGDLAEAVRVSTAAIAWGEKSGNVTVLIGTRADLARVYALLGDLDQALALAQQAYAIASSRFEMLAAWPQAALIHIHLLRAELAEAEAVQAVAPNYRDVQQRLSFMVPMWGNLALANIEVALVQGQFERSAAEAAELLERLANCDIRFLLPEAQLRLGEALLGQGQLSQAQSALQIARQEAEALGSRRLLWPILAALAEAAARGAAPDQAAVFRGEARAIVDHLAAQAPTAQLRETFLGTPGVRALAAT